MAFARSVTIEEAAREELDEQIRRFTRIEDIYRGLEWRIARNPEAGAIIPRSDPAQFIVKSRPFFFPVPLILTMAYHLTDDLVTITLIIVDSDKVIEQ